MVWDYPIDFARVHSHISFGYVPHSRRHGVFIRKAADAEINSPLIFGQSDSSFSNWSLERVWKSHLRTVALNDVVSTVDRALHYKQYTATTFWI